MFGAVRCQFHPLGNPLAGQQALPDKHAIDIRTLGTKRQVKVAAHVSAQVIHNSEGKLLKVQSHSAFAGKILKIATDYGDRSLVKT